jgi:MFS transporter, FSR family, fosmidomycin resistance protein
MSQNVQNRAFWIQAAWRSLISLTTLFLLIEFIDEFNYGIAGAVLPAQRDDLALNYAQVGLLLGLPHLVNVFIEPFLMLLGDTSLRKKLVLGGGLALSLSLLMTALAPSFGWLLAAAVLMYPASGAFVTLAQATLMDLYPGRESQMMARWVLSGSLANLTGPMFSAGLFALALTWRTAFVVLALMAFGLTLWTSRANFPVQKRETSTGPLTLFEAGVQEARQLVQGLRTAVTDLRVLRWILLLELSDLMLDIHTSYLALYFRDVVGTGQTQTSLLFGLFMGASLLSDVAMVYLLERYPGRGVVRFSAGVIAVLYPAWLLLPGLGFKIVLAFAIKLLTLGWYTVLQGESYASLPERKGTLLAIQSTAGIFGGLLPWLVGWLAGQYGLQSAMWLLWAGPLSLLLFVPGTRTTPHPDLR